MTTAKERREEAQYGRFKAAVRHGPVLDQGAFGRTDAAGDASQRNASAKAAAKARRRRRKWRHQKGAPQNVARRSRARPFHNLGYGPGSLNVGAAHRGYRCGSIEVQTSSL